MMKTLLTALTSLMFFSVLNTSCQIQEPINPDTIKTISGIEYNKLPSLSSLKQVKNNSLTKEFLGINVNDIKTYEDLKKANEYIQKKFKGNVRLLVIKDTLQNISSVKILMEPSFKKENIETQDTDTLNTGMLKDIRPYKWWETNGYPDFVLPIMECKICVISFQHFPAEPISYWESLPSPPIASLYMNFNSEASYWMPCDVCGGEFSFPAPFNDFEGEFFQMDYELADWGCGRGCGCNELHLHHVSWNKMTPNTYH